jgi:hypothetical protein
MQIAFGKPPTQKMFVALAKTFLSGGEAVKATSYAVLTANISPNPINTYDGACHRTLIGSPVARCARLIIPSTTIDHQTANESKTEPIIIWCVVAILISRFTNRGYTKFAMIDPKIKKDAGNI